MTIEGMTFVITGAARGIGAETARLAAERGANVVLSDLLVEAGQTVATEIESAGGRAVFVPADITRDDDVERLMDAAVDTFGGIDVLHNNAGIHDAMLTSDLSFEELRIDVFDRVLAVNLRAPFVCAKAAVPHLRRSTRGPSIINAGSTASFAAYPAGVSYGTSKGGIAALTKNLAVALAPDGIRANCYCPATIDTPMVSEVAASARRDGARDRTEVNLDTHLVRRVGEPRDVAELVCFLASDQASFVNGVVWLIDGGSLAWRSTVSALGID
jgi:NAD(P)-dependent dehydrogenase (short-subunit alcohol dehydrogenase family)